MHLHRMRIQQLRMRIHQGWKTFRGILNKEMTPGADII